MIPGMEDLPRWSRIVRLLLVATICTILFMNANGVAVPIAQCNITGCTIDNAYGLWLDRLPCKVSIINPPLREGVIIQHYSPRY